MSGEMIERNFFIMLWSQYREGVESYILSRMLYKVRDGYNNKKLD